MSRRVVRHAVVQPLDSSIRLIPLTRNQNAIVDTGDYEWLSQWNWQAYWSPLTRTFYARRTDCSNGGHKDIMMHNLILDLPEGLEVDHRDQNTLNNRRLNLRPATRSQNSTNSKRPSSKTSGYRGVYWKPVLKKYQVLIRANGKLINLGCFADKELAARTYDFAAIALHGEFARTNFKY